MAGEQPYPSGYEAAAPHIAHVHIKDARATDDGKLRWTVVGDGEIDYAGHFAALKKCRIHGSGFSGNAFQGSQRRSGRVLAAVPGGAEASDKRGLIL